MVSWADWDETVEDERTRAALESLDQREPEEEEEDE
jgi:hypothetical protein